MILTSLIVGAVIATSVVGIVAAFWNSIKEFLKKALAKVKKIVSGVVYGCKVFIKKISEGVKEISRSYSKVGENWQMTTTTQTIPASEVPPEMLERARQAEEVDITDEAERELELTA